MDGKGGLANLDVDVLSPEQQEKLQQFKIKTRIDNEKYLRSHPEVEELIGGFMRNVLLKRPTDIHEFAADYFNNINLPTGPVKEGDSDRANHPTASTSCLSPFKSADVK
ncbi:RIIa domain-containing protein 1 [Melanotaenia boesemani]|uniref:RIIa domain-containing protein 1 n=1 Tax=Melanotaenia boesemani TaxID=1250792 RepID=UPI001C056012|nr:RIIa domain-containing protein 1 [Melanotaenia boesemani]